jgi:hypothetical protein
MINAFRRTAVMAAGAALVSVGSLVPAGAAARSNHTVGGIESAIGCTSSKLCVATGTDGKSHATYVVVKNGKPGAVKKLSGLSTLGAISCPSSKGCVAVGENSKDTDPVAVVFSSTGKITSKKTLKVAAGVSLGAISCASLKSCELAGSDQFKTKFVIASWNGKTIKTHELSAHGGSAPGIAGISCSGSTCLAVGSKKFGVGVALLIKHKTLSKFITIGFANAQAATGVSCVSTSTCYLVGDFPDPAGYVATIHAGKVTAHSTFASAPFGISCHAANCIVAGEEVSKTTPIAAGGFNGDLTPVASGKAQAVQEVLASGGYSGIAVKGSFFAAVGGAAKSGSLHSLITTG